MDVCFRPWMLIAEWGFSSSYWLDFYFYLFISFYGLNSKWGVVGVVRDTTWAGVGVEGNFIFWIKKKIEAKKRERMTPRGYFSLYFFWELVEIVLSLRRAARIDSLQLLCTGCIPVLFIFFSINISFLFTNFVVCLFYILICRMFICCVCSY